RKLSFKDQREFSHDHIRNIRSTSPGSPWTFYTHRSVEIRLEETPKCLDISFWPQQGCNLLVTNSLLRHTFLLTTYNP
ncbi:hypothetical protein S245_063464, partial [Arachis hypogaea]